MNTPLLLHSTIISHFWQMSQILTEISDFTEWADVIQEVIQDEATAFQDVPLEAIVSDEENIDKDENLD